MINRRGIIAALLAGAAAPARAQSKWRSSGPEPLTVEFQKGTVRDYSQGLVCYATMAYPDMVACPPPAMLEEPKYALVVKYGNREVKLTARQVMDALEGK